MIKLIILSIVQGLTEFLPVSSSGHLVLFQEWLRVKEGQLALDVLLHFATLLAVLFYFRKDIIKILSGMINRQASDLKLGGFIIVSTLITVLIALMGNDFFESLFVSAKWVSIALMFTALFLVRSKKHLDGERMLSSFQLKDSLMFGLAQGLSIVPGISRSGITISLLLGRKFSREEAFRLSFLASIPAITGAFILKLKEIRSLIELSNIWAMAMVFMLTFVVGYFALVFLKRVIVSRSLAGFGYYCFSLAVVIFITEFLV